MREKRRSGEEREVGEEKVMERKDKTRKERHGERGQCERHIAREEGRQKEKEEFSISLSLPYKY